MVTERLIVEKSGEDQQFFIDGYAKTTGRQAVASCASTAILGGIEMEGYVRMSRKLDDLSLRFKPLAIELLARLVEAGIPVLVVDTLRTQAEHATNLAKGVSWTTHSKHLDGDAIDVCPYEVYQATGPDKLAWDATHPIWLKIGTIGETLGLRWGGRWKQQDLGHFEYPPKGIDHEK